MTATSQRSLVPDANPRYAESPRQTRWSKILSGVISVCALAYLAAIPMGWVGENRLGPTEAIILVALLFFHSVIADRLKRLTFSGKGVELQIREVRAEQRKQGAEIESLRFLVSYYVTDPELDLLKRLAGERDSSYSIQGDWQKEVFNNELRRLRSLALIAVIGGWEINKIPKQGRLTDYCRITPRGEDYLNLRSEVQSASSALNPIS